MKQMRSAVLALLLCVVLAAGLAVAACGDKEEPTTTVTTAQTTTSTAETAAATAAGQPSARAGHVMVYDPGSGKVILFGGSTGANALNDTWVYDPAANTWAELKPSGGLPPACWAHSMGYDPAAGQVILLGGLDAQFYSFNDTWAYDPAANTWTELKPAGSMPGERAPSPMAYDPASGKMIIFGGGVDVLDPSTFLNDTWAYDPSANTWTELKPTGNLPPGRNAHMIFYDPTGGRAILFGGEGAGGYLSDTWAYDPAANAWTQLQPGGTAPPARWAQAMAYDPINARAIMFGGCQDVSDPDSFFSDTWAYEPAANTWTELKPAGDVPSARNGAAMVYDPASHTIILFGGQLGGTGGPLHPSDDTWLYDPAANTWTELHPGTTGPTAVASSSTTAAASSTTTSTTMAATKTELDVLMIEALSPAHAMISSAVLRYPDWSQIDKDDFAWAATTIRAVKDRAAVMQPPTGSEETYQHLATFLDDEIQIIEEMETNAEAQAPELLTEAGTQLLRDASVELGQFLSLAFVQAVASAPPVPASAHPGSTEASGTWTWVVNDMGRETQTGGASLMGFETGSWTGTFEGASHEPFVGMMGKGSSALWAMLWIRFEDANVSGKHGGLDLRVTALSPSSGPPWMGGEWTIIDGTGELQQLRGQGTWVWDNGLQGGKYTGTIWEE